MKPYREQPARPLDRSIQLRAILKASGRATRCDVTSCAEYQQHLLQIHHKVPARLNFDQVDAPDNLVWLCPAHHALVERYYWNDLCRVEPELTTEIRHIARMFKARQVPHRQIPELQQQTKKLWRELNWRTRLRHVWIDRYDRAVAWAGRQQTLRKVDPNVAITELVPWWVEFAGEEPADANDQVA